MDWWSIDAHIGECKPFPAQVVVYKGETDEHMTYVPECCETPSGLEAENKQLRKLLIGAFEDMDAWQRVIASSDQWGYGKGCLDRLCELRDAMQELGMKVVDE